MRWVVESDARAYADRVLPWLAREPVLTTVPATILLGVLDRVYAESWLAWLADGARRAAMSPAWRCGRRRTGWC